MVRRSWTLQHRDLASKAAIMLHLFSSPSLAFCDEGFDALIGVLTGRKSRAVIQVPGAIESQSESKTGMLERLVEVYTKQSKCGKSWDCECGRRISRTTGQHNPAEVWTISKCFRSAPGGVHKSPLRSNKLSTIIGRAFQSVHARQMT
jgi:hypothetical protein